MVGLRKNLSPVAIVVALAFMLASAAIPQPIAAQDDTVTIYLHPQIAETGDSIPQMCLSLAGASNVGCDENADGLIEFQGIHPGTYTVVQETIIAGIVQLGDNVTITVADSPAEQYFPITFNELGATTPVPTTPADDTVTVLLHPVLVEADRTLTPMCLSLEGASNVGCDENGDGLIEFDGVHPGTYTVVQETLVAGVAQLGSDTTITVNVDASPQYFTIEFHEVDQGATTPVPTVAPTMSAPTEAASQPSGNQTTATSLPNTGSGTTSPGTVSLAALALLAIASLATLVGCTLRWRTHRHA